MSIAYTVIGSERVTTCELCSTQTRFASLEKWVQIKVTTTEVNFPSITNKVLISWVCPKCQKSIPKTLLP